MALAPCERAVPASPSPLRVTEDTHSVVFVSAAVSPMCKLWLPFQLLCIVTNVLSLVSGLFAASGGGGWYALLYRCPGGAAVPKSY